MIDTHAHLDFPEFEKDREEVIARAFSSGVKKIVNVGVDLERSRKSIEIAEKFDGIFATIGFHPDYFTKHETYNMKHDWIGELRELAKSEKVVAIGETGLDYYHVTRDTQHVAQDFEKIKKKQKKGFLAQIELARELNLPVIVHCREVYPMASDGTSGWFGVWGDLYEIISKVRPFPSEQKIPENNQGSTFPFPDVPSGNSSRSNLRFVLHCYSGDKEDTEKFLKLKNVYFSFSGNITYPKPADRAEKLAEAVRMIPLDKIMLDSDAPFLAPQEFRGKRNEPAYVKYIAEKIAEIKQISVEEVERTTDKNAAKFFFT